MNERISARIGLLDKQIVDSDRLPIGRVDDLELRVPSSGPPEVVAILTGAEALGGRIGGLLGRLMVASSARLRPRTSPPMPPRIDPVDIEELEPLVKLRLRSSDLQEVAGLERWLGRHVVEKLPGTGHADQ